MREKIYETIRVQRALRGQDEPIHLVAIASEKEGPGKVVGAPFAADDSDGIARFIEEQNQQGQRNIYFTLNQVGGDPKHGKPSKNDISAVLGYGVDIDPPASCADLSAWREKKASELRESGQPPTAIWCSGNGIQAAWMLRAPAPIESAQDREQHEAINAALAQMFGGDAIQNIDRLFRVPGTTNYPGPSKRAKGRVVTQAYVIEGPNDRLYSPEDFANLVSAGALPACGHTPPDGHTTAAGHDPEALIAELPEDLVQRIQAPVPEGQRSDQACKVVRTTFEHGLTPDQVEALLGAYPNGVAAKYVKRGDLRAEIARHWQKWRKKHGNPLRYKDFRAHLPSHSYINIKDGEFWPASSINAIFSAVETGEVDPKTGKPVKVRASTWLDKNQAVHAVTWLPGAPMVISDRMISAGGWIDEPGYTTFNLYRPPMIPPGDAAKAGPWLELVSYLYPDDAEHIIKWLAHRVQRPGEKLNHALVLYGLPGIGKDTILAPAIDAVGPWNVATIAPDAILGNFNPYVQSVILLINEGADLGDINRYTFYERLKAYTATPPDVLRCNQKHMREYTVPNVTSVIITTNYKQNGLFLPPDDRRHYVAASERNREDFSEGYWQNLHDWYDGDGKAHVAAYLAEHDLTGFNPKAPPKQTDAFLSMVDANRAPEDAEFADALDKLGWPDAVTKDDIRRAVDDSFGFAEWLDDRRNHRKVSHRMEDAGYERVSNPDADDGLWRLKSGRRTIYAKKSLPVSERIAEAHRLVRGRSS